MTNNVPQVRASFPPALWTPGFPYLVKEIDQIVLEELRLLGSYEFVRMTETLITRDHPPRAALRDLRTTGSSYGRPLDFAPCGAHDYAI